MSVIEKIAMVIAAIGAIDVGLMVLNFELVASVMDPTGIVAKIIFAIVGLSGIWALVKVFKK